jgi:hypothetical protein
MRFFTFYLMAFFIIIVGCTDNADDIKCGNNQLLVGGRCCSDLNLNQICDDFETRTEYKLNDIDHNLTKLKDYFRVSEDVSAASAYNVTELENAIIKIFNESGITYFRDDDRENLTGIDDTYDVRISTLSKFQILKMKKKYNFFSSFEDFSDFIDKRFDVDVKDTKIWAQWYIDYYRQYNPLKWEQAEYDYDYNLTLSNYNRTSFYIERHGLVFYRPPDIGQGGYISTNTIVWCTEDLIVEVHPDHVLKTGWNPGSKRSDAKININREHETRLKSMINDTYKIISICNN